MDEYIVCKPKVLLTLRWDCWIFSIYWSSNSTWMGAFCISNFLLTFSLSQNGILIKYSQWHLSPGEVLQFYSLFLEMFTNWLFFLTKKYCSMQQKQVVVYNKMTQLIFIFLFLIIGCGGCQEWNSSLHNAALNFSVLRTKRLEKIGASKRAF